MRILIEGENLTYYLAKCHEAFRTGLRACFDTRCFGKGYPRYNHFLKTFDQIQERMFPDEPPDLIIPCTWNPAKVECGFRYSGLAESSIPKALYLADYWSEAGEQLDRYIDLVCKHRIEMIPSYFPQPLDMWKETPLGELLVYMPPCVDPAIFNDWQMKKTYDVGFLAAGTVNIEALYPERRAIHQKILERKDLRYLWAEHPGWKQNRESPLVGKNFSRAINSCRIFVTTGGIYRNANAKYIEILASNTLLLADEPIGGDLLGLRDGINYVAVNEQNILEKVDYYLCRPGLSGQIAEQGYLLAMRRHSCYARAMDFYEAVRARMYVCQ